MGVEVNYLAVLAAAIVSMGVGFLWYGPLFGKAWMKLKGLTKEDMKPDQKEMTKLYGLTFILALITAYVLTHIMALSENFFGYSPLQTGITSAFWVWLGFTLPVQVTATIFGNKNWKLLAIDSGHNLASFIVMGVVLGFLG